MKKILLTVSHVLTLAVGIGLGIYLLPILIAPPAPTVAEVSAQAAKAEFKGEFRRDLKGSDALHWGEGTVSVGTSAVAFTGKLAPGPDYKLYLSPEFVDNKADFLRLKPGMARVGDVKTFDNFVVPVPAGIDPKAYTAAIVWCETFSMFITAAKYR